MPARPPLLDDPTFQVLLRSPTEITTLLGSDGEVLYISPSVTNVLGRRPDDIIGTSGLGDVHPEDRERLREDLAGLVETPGASLQTEYRVRHEDGSWRVLNTYAWNLLEDARVGAVLVRSRDVTENRALRARVGRTERYLEQLVNHVPVVFCLLDSDGTVLLSEGRGLEGIGLRPGEAVGKSVFDLYAHYHPVTAAVERALDGEEVRAELRVEGRIYETLLTPRTDEEGRVLGVSGVSLDRTEEARAREADAFKARLLDFIGQAVIVTDPEGRITYWNRAATELYGWEREEVMGRSVVEVTVPEDAEDEASEILATLPAGGTWSGEFRVQRKDGTTFPVLTTVAPMLDEDGEMTGVIGVSVDLSERRALEARLEEARRVEAIGRLAGGVAHDFNNMITAIRGYARLLLGEVGPEEEHLRPDLEEIDRVAERAGEITAQLLAYGRRQVSQPRRLDLAETVGSMTGVLSRLVGEDVGLTFVADEGPCPVEIDPSQVERLVLNLAVNAREAMSGGGEMEIRVRPAEPDAVSTAEPGCDEEEGPWVELSVRDTGRGIAEAHLPHVFEPFYTTKARGGGTGLGLATVQGVAMQNGGCVAVESEPGEGATFRVYLPRAGAEDVRSQGEQPR